MLRERKVKGQLAGWGGKYAVDRGGLFEFRKWRGCRIVDLSMKGVTLEPLEGSEAARVGDSLVVDILLSAPQMVGIQVLAEVRNVSPDRMGVEFGQLTALEFALVRSTLKSERV